jgi:hypothetical protein
MDSYPLIDLYSLSDTADIDLDLAFACLDAFYEGLDQIFEQTISSLALPCKIGCADCCKECVFLTPLEFYRVWDWVQINLDAVQRDGIINRALEIYKRHREDIAAFELPPPDGDSDHFALARELKFTCPLLAEDNTCLVYPVRDICSRLFGCSFDQHGDIYGCLLVQQQLEGQQVTLLPAFKTARRLNDLPLSHKRQLYPFYIHQLYGLDK